MTTMSKRSGTSDTLRSGNEFAISPGSGRALADAAETWFSATTEWQREMMKFVLMRLEKDSEAARDVVACKNLADMQAIQSRWIEETLRDYSSETTKLITICARSANSGRRLGG